ncbi:MAG TPA: indole-3-glycerol phosphate synthase TrpC [Vicinamibacterales bacterium]|nr:indole-3-glycerol phosphate synthase TrpC [Vicinamibacterales bacterium]
MSGSTAGAGGGDLLATIVAATRRAVEVRAAAEPAAALAARAEAAPVRPGLFRRALARTDRLNVIAECKRRSPARGLLRPAYDPAAIARGYEAAGAAAVSVLTEPTFFDGALEHLQAVRAAVTLPVLRKDFIVDDYQLLEARAAGADAVLLIVAALGRAELERRLARAAGLGLAALVEVHDAEELAVAVGAGADLIGVNNRNLRDLSVSLDTSYRLMAGMPRDTVAVSESGLKSAADLQGLRAAGYRAFLLGERLMTSPDPGEALRLLLDGSPAPLPAGPGRPPC